MTREELEALLRSWHDYFPLPTTWTGDLQRRAAKPGPAPFRKVKCEMCEGRGRLQGGWVCKPCKGRGSFSIDDYTGEVVDDTETSWEELLAGVVDCWKCGGWGRLGAHAETRPDPRTARLCPECDGIGKVPALLARRGESEARPRQGDRQLDALDDQAKKRDQLHAYRELARAMNELQERAPGIHFLIAWVYILEAQQASPANVAAIDTGLDFLLERLRFVKPPDLILVQEENRRSSMRAAKGRGADTRAQEIRNNQIRRRRDEGATIAAIAAEFDIDKSRVSRIVNGK